MHNLVNHFILQHLSQNRRQGHFTAASLFVDISGFTALTEALMQHGQVGAEALASTIRSLITPMVQAVYDQGGFVTHTAGDAFTALFPVDEKTAGTEADGALTIALTRAVGVAFTIQQHMRVSRTQTTPYGTFNFAAKVGAAVGETQWGLFEAPDRSRRACYYRGSAVDACAHAEHHAKGGDIILTGETYARLPVLAAEPVEDSFRLTGTALPEGALVGEPQVDLKLRAFSSYLLPVSVLASFFPNELFRYDIAGEFRQTLAMFISLQGSPTYEQLAQVTQAVFTLQAQYGGYLNKIDFGDKGCNMLMFWGAPTSQENDLARALNFILDLRAQSPVPLRAGLTYRMAFAGFMGSPTWEEYTCYGRGVNLAARHMMTAPWGSVWLDHEIVERVEKKFLIEAAGKREFKGFAEPQPVYALIGRRGATASALFYRHHLVGRDGELAQLHSFVEPIFEGGFAGIAVIVGEPGMGKSRLAHDFVQTLVETYQPVPLILVAQTDEIVRNSLNPFRYFLLDYFEQVTNDSDETNRANFTARLNTLITQTMEETLAYELDRTRSFLGALIGLRWPDTPYERLDPQLRFENTLTALTTLLRAESRLHPVVMVLEDLQWLDADSRQYLLRLSRIGADYPLALLTTSRVPMAADLTDPTLTRLDLTLKELLPDALEQFANDFLDGPPSPELMELLIGYTAGNPFFAEQLLRYLQAEHLLAETPSGWRHETTDAVLMPTDARAVLVARLDRLTQHLKNVLQTATVLGREFEVRLLSQVLRIEDLGPQLSAIEREAMWSPLAETRYSFRHMLLRDVAYDMQLVARRRELHRLAAEAIETLYANQLDARAGDLAHHYGEAQVTDLERHYTLRAGQVAAAVYANAEALKYFDRALALTPETDQATQYALLLAREKIYDLLGTRGTQHQTLQALTTLADEMGEPDRRAEVRLRYASYAEATGDYPQTINAACDAVALGQTAGDKALEAAAYLQWGIGAWRLGDYATARVELDRALELARATPLPQVELDSLRNLGIVARHQDQHAEAQMFNEQALALSRAQADRRGESRVLGNMGNVAFRLGNMTEARGHFESALRSSRSIGDRRTEMALLGNLGVLTSEQGDYPPAQHYYEQSVRLSREVGDQMALGAQLGNLCLLMCQQGQYVLACDYGLEAIRVAREVESKNMEASATTYVGHAFAGLGRWEEAIEYYQQALQLRQHLKHGARVNEPLAGLARVSLAQGTLPTAQAYVNEILSYLETGQLEGSGERFSIYLTCYQVLQAAGDERAAPLLNTAHTLLQEQAARLDATTRRLFMENIEAHRLLAQLAKQEKS